MLGERDGARITVAPARRRCDHDEPRVLPRRRAGLATALAATQTGDSFTVASPPPAGDPIYIVATTPDGTPWLVASHAAWQWR